MRRALRRRDVFGAPLRDGGAFGLLGSGGQRSPRLTLRQQGPFGRRDHRGRRGPGGGRGHRAQAGLDQVRDPFHRVVQREAVPPGQVPHRGQAVELPGDRPLLALDDGPGVRQAGQPRAALGGDLAPGQPFRLLPGVGPGGGDVQAEQRPDPVRPARPEPDAGSERPGGRREGQRDQRVQRHGPEQIPQLTPADDIPAHQQGADAAVGLVAGN